MLKSKIFRYIFTTVVFLYSILFIFGCSHNLQANGVWLVSPYFSLGYGSFACVRENTKVTQINDTTKDSSKTTQTLEVKDQTTGYDVELSKK